MIKRDNSLDRELHTRKIIFTCGLLVITFLILLFIYLVFFSPKSDYLIISGQTFLKYEKNNSFINVLDDSVDYSKKNFYIYRDKKELGKFKLSISNDKTQGTFFNNQQQISLYEDYYIASTKKIDFIDYQVEPFNEEDFNYIKNVMENREVSNIKELSIAEKIVLDVDHDKALETIYIASNYATAHEGQEVFSIVYVQDMDKAYFLIEDIQSFEDMEQISSYNILSILDLNNDKQLELIIEKQYRNLVQYYLYGMKDNKYILLYSEDGV